MMKKKMIASGAVALAGVLAVRAQKAFVYQYDGMNETNRVEVKSVKVSGVNRTLIWKADRDYPQCGVGFEFVATGWSTNNYVFAPAAIYDGNRFDISYVRYPPYITNWEMPKKPNRPVVTTNIHHLNKNGTDARIDFLAGETSAPMVGYWDSVKKEGHLYLADPTTPLGETGFSVRESPKKGTCTFVIAAPGIRTTKYTMCRSRREDCGDRAPNVKRDTTVTFGVSVVDFKAKDIDAFLARAFDVRKLRTGRTVHAKVEDPETVIRQILANEDTNHWYEDKSKGLGYYCNKPGGNSPFGHLQLGWNGVPVYLLPILERPTPERLRRCALCWDAISKMNGKSGLYYAINKRGELLGDAFGNMAKLRDHAMMRRTAITIYYGIQSLQKMEALGVAIKPEWKESVRKACDGVVAVWKRYGQLGQYVKVDSGEIHAPNSTNGALVPGALALASKYFGNPAYMDAAKETGCYLYEHDLAKGYCGGGPAEILEAPDSESSCELGESFIALWELTGEREWVEKAKAAAAMYASWVEAFDYPFPKTSRMGQLGIKATGSVWASVQNRHSAPGPYVISADWLVKLSQATGDSRYAQVFYDNALNIAQYATTEKNRFMPKGDPGTLTERVNTCDWEGRRGIGAVMARDSNQAWENVALFTLMALEKNTLYCPREIDATWCSLGTSITWYNSNVANARGKFTRSYQDRVLDVLRFKGFINRGVNGGVVASQHGKISKADYYTIEHGVNDWGQRVKPGVMADYENNASNKTFYANYRILIDQIRAINPQAKIILCTPRKSYGFGKYLPPKETLPKNGNYLRQYAEAVRAIAKKEGFVVADFYANCGEEPELADLSIDVALHPNDPGYQRMADEIIKAFDKIIPKPQMPVSKDLVAAASAEVWYVPGWNRTTETNGLAYTSCTNVFKDKVCSFWGWDGDRSWSTSAANADVAAKRLAAEIAATNAAFRSELVIVGHSLGGRIVARTLAELSRMDVKVGQGIMLAPAIPMNDPDVAQMGGGCVRPAIVVVNPKDSVLKYCYDMVGGEGGPALGRNGSPAALANVVEYAVPKTITNETKIDAAWGRSETVKRVCNHLAAFYFTELRRILDGKPSKSAQMRVPQGRLNLEWKVIDAGVWWDVLDTCGGWKLERNIVTGHCRIISPERKRAAWGPEIQMRASFNKIRAQRP